MKQRCGAIIFFLFIAAKIAFSQGVYLWNVGQPNSASGVFCFDPSLGYVNDSVNIAGAAGNLMLASNGKMYFNGSNGDVGYGGICSFDPTNNSSSYLYYFGLTPNDGIDPIDAFIQANNGKIYGVTNEGGLYSVGTLFSYDISDSIYSKLYDFDTSTGAPAGGLLQASDGKLYGATSVGFIDSLGLYFAVGCKIYSFDLSSNTFATVYQFDLGEGLGSYVAEHLIEPVSGQLWGIGPMDLPNDEGSIPALFSLDLANSSLTFYPFPIADSATPEGTLLKANNGSLYGISVSGGTPPLSCDEGGLGFIYSYNILSGQFNIIHSFSCAYTDGYSTTDGFAVLDQSLMQASDGKIYGSIEGGYTVNVLGDTTTSLCGVIFSVDPATNNYQVIDNNMCASSAAFPMGYFIQGPEFVGTGVSNINETDLRIYPNPATGQLILQYSGLQNNAAARIMDITGRRLISDYVTGEGKFIFDVHSLPAGIYLVELTQNNMSVTNKFIKVVQ